MKKRINSFALFCLVLLWSQVSMAQAPVLSETMKFTFGGLSDIPFGLTIDNNDNIFINGQKNIGIFGQVRAVLAKFSYDSELEWIIIDSANTSSNFNHLTYLEQNQAVLWYIDDWSSPGNGFLSKVSIETGQEIWHVQVPFYVLTSLQDTIISVACGYDAQVLVLDQNGNILRQFPINGTYGATTVRVYNGYLWIFTSYSDSGIVNFSGFVAKYDIYTGQLVWRQNVKYAIRVFGDIDDYGNAYLGASKATDNPQGWLEYFLMKLDSDGNIIWQKQWFAHQNYDANYNNWLDGVIVSSYHNQVILHGATEKSENEDTGEQSAYVVGFNATTGDSLWKMQWEYDPNAIINQINGAAFNNNNELLLLGNTYTGGDIPNQGYLQKYSLPSLAVDDNPIAIPNKLCLQQNYPNPFNQTTVIQYSLPESGNVELTIYNLLGQEIEILVSRFQTTGDYAVQWEAKNVPSGVYLYTLETPSRVLCKKLIHLK